jgi:hypothetical protein
VEVWLVARGEHAHQVLVACAPQHSESCLEGGRGGNRAENI